MFPNPAALLRLAGSVLVETHDEWQVADKHYLSETTLALLATSDEPDQTIAATAALTASWLPQSLARTRDSSYTTPRDVT